jgi:hypothetical protein
MASIFIPDECPLVPHMINSYKKHHLKNRPQFPKNEREEEPLQQVPSKIIEITLKQSAKDSPVKKESVEDEVNLKKAKLIDKLMNAGFNNTPNVTLLR